MILPPGGPQALKEIEDQICEGDPGLAIILSEFAADPGRVRARVRRERIRDITLMALLWALLVTCIIMMAVTAHL